MALPPPPVAGSPAPVTAADPSAVAANEDDKNDADEGKAVIKQFGPSEDADGNPVPTPTPGGVDCASLANDLYAALSGKLATLGITDVESWIEEADAVDKTKFPGNKNGRIAYNMIRALTNIYKQYALLNKQRGVGGVAAMKKKMEEKENKIAELEKKLAELMAKLG